jgi:RNA polymerase sigma factor (TIGR02999 family)
VETPPPRTITRLLRAWSHGDAAASEQLLELLYDDLKRRARQKLRGERADHTLQPTALVHEAWLRLNRQSEANWQNRAQFLGLAAVMMRRVLVDYARGRRADKREGSWVRVTLDEDLATGPGREVDSLDLEAALEELAAQDERQARLVELRVFGGLTFDDAAEVLGVSPATAKRDWTHARAWLFRRLKQHARSPARR